MFVTSFPPRIGPAGLPGTVIVAGGVAPVGASPASVTITAGTPLAAAAAAVVVRGRAIATATSGAAALAAVALVAVLALIPGSIPVAASAAGRPRTLIAGGRTVGAGAAEGGHLLAARDVGIVGLFLGTVVVPADPELLEGFADEADGGALS